MKDQYRERKDDGEGENEIYEIEYRFSRAAE